MVERAILEAVPKSRHRLEMKGRIRTLKLSTTIRSYCVVIWGFGF